MRSRTMFLAQRIRVGWFDKVDNDDGSRMDGDEPIEVDKTFVGGKEKNKHASKKLHQGRGGVGKAIV